MISLDEMKAHWFLVTDIKTIDDDWRKHIRYRVNNLVGAAGYFEEPESKMDSVILEGVEKHPKGFFYSVDDEIVSVESNQGRLMKMLVMAEKKS